MVASRNLLTTSGVLVKNSQGESFMAVASHGFPNGDLQVRHPKPDSSVIGEVTKRIGDTDIALVKLQADISFTNETFQNDLEPNGVFLPGIRDPFAMRRFDTISMNNPYTGLIDGQFLAVSLNRMPTNAHEEHQWVMQAWKWSGQDKSPLPVAAAPCRILSVSRK
jgi:hypothetical protein